MDPGDRPERDYARPPADSDMQAEPTTVSEPATGSGEIEMQALDDSTSHLMIDMESTTPTPATTASATPLSASSFPSSSSLPLQAASEALRTSMRRARVEHDHDDERDRRHPSQRVGSPSHPLNTSISQSSTSSSSQTTSIPTHPLETPDFLGRSPGPSNSATSPGPSAFNSRPFRFYQHMMPFDHPHNHNIASPSTSSLPTLNLPPQQNNPTSGSDSTIIPPLVATRVATAPNAPLTSGSNSDATTRQMPRPNLRHQYLGGFAITIDVNGAMTTVPLTGPPPPFLPPRSNPDATGSLPPEAPGNDEQPNQPSVDGPVPVPPPPQAQGDGGMPPSPMGGNAFTDLLRRVSILTALSFGNAGLFERDLDDPERANKLVEGLEDVPVGLVRRLERVGKTGDEESSNGDAADPGSGGLGDGGCAICWERLLEGVEDTEEKEGEKGASDAAEATDTMQTSRSDMDTDMTAPQPIASSSEPIPIDVETSTEADTNTGTKGYQRIVALPCAHVFHAQCLVPWFSKPKQTTCPICRFNIDPENLTYTSRAQRRAAARRAREQQQGTEGGAGTEEGEGLGEVGEGVGGEGPGAVGFDFPLGMGGAPFVIPLRGGHDGPQPGDAPPTGAQARPGATDDDTTGGADVPNGNSDRPLHDIVTIGFDMYIGRGPPPFPFRGPGMVQIPVPGPPGPPDAPTANAPPTGGSPAMNNGNPVLGADVPPSTNNTGTPPVTGAGNGGTGGPRGAAFAIPIPVGQGFGRALEEVFSRLFGGGGGGGTEGNTEPAPATGAPNAGNGGSQPQGPAMFGPERPPMPLPGSFPLPANIGIGLGGIGGQRLPPFMSPSRGRGQPGGQEAQGAPGHQAGQPPMFETTLPLFDLLFGSPPPQAQGQAQAPDTQPAPQPAQPQPQHPQDANARQPPPPPPGFGWTFVPGSPPPRPASAPTPGQQRQEPRKQWAPPPAPGLTLRQRVEKREQEAGLRCCDVSCGVGPSDDDPWTDVGQEGIKQLCIRSSTNEDGGMSAVDSGVGLDGLAKVVRDGEDLKRELVCSHTFHSSCLVSAERVALALRDANVAFVGPQGKEEVEVSCPVCRGVGRVSREEWEKGLQALG